MPIPVLLLTLTILFGQLNLDLKPVHAANPSFQYQMYANPHLIAQDDDEDWDDEDWDDEDWDDEDWDDEDWDDEDWEDEDWEDEDWEDEEYQEPVELKRPQQAQTKQQTTSPANTRNAQAQTNTNTAAATPTPVEPEVTSASQKIEEQKAAIATAPKEEAVEAADGFGVFMPVKSTEEKYADIGEDYLNLYAIYKKELTGLDPDNPEDMKQINKLLEIVGTPKPPVQQKATLKQAKRDDPIVNFSARNIPARDAFATLARISGKSITVSGLIRDKDLISVVEINDQPFTKAFLSLAEAASVDFTVSGDNYTILKRRGGQKSSIFSFDSTDVDLSLPIDQRRANLSYDNEDLSSIIKDIANRYGVDVVMTATPTERVTLRVRGVTVDEAMDLILSGSQFKYIQKGAAYVVYSTSNKNFALDKKTVFFPLKYLEAKEVNKLLPGDLKNIVKVSDNQNAVIAEGSKAQLTQLFEFLRTIDKPIPQVELDVKLVEVSKILQRAHNIIEDTLVLGRIGGANGGFSVDIGEDELNIFQQRPTFSNSDTRAQLKVSQRLLATSGKSAKINFDQDQNILLNSADPNNNNNIGVVQSQRIQRITAGNSMNITPIVGAGGIVSLKVEIEVSANQGIDDNTGVPAQTIRRRISSEIQVANHETISIGGLFDNQNSTNKTNKIPFLSDIPLIGALFENNTKDNLERELLVLITPNVRTNLEQEDEATYVQATGTYN